MNKTQREEWDKLINKLYNSLDPHVIDIALLTVADVYIHKLERELQAFKHKKAIAAILQKGTSP